MSEWGYLAKIIKDAKKAGKVAGKVTAKKIATDSKSVNDIPHHDYNQQLRNFLDGIQSERLTSLDDFEYATSPYTRYAAEDLLNNIYTSPADNIGNSLYNLSSIAEGMADRDWIIPRGAFIDPSIPKTDTLTGKEVEILEAIKQRLKNFDVNEAARDILEEKAAMEGRKLGGEFRLERPDGSGW